MSDVQDTAMASYSPAKPIATTSQKPKSKPAKKKKPEISDSWEDDAENLSSSSSEPDTPTASSSSTKNQPPAPPPPTPATPSFLSPGVRSPYSTSTFDQRHNIDRGVNEPRDRAGSLSENRESGAGYTGVGGGRERAVTYSDRQTEDERQLKTDAVARRMIANALGVKSRSTAEQKEYESSLKAKVRSEREERKKAEEEMERAKKAIWDD